MLQEACSLALEKRNIKLNDIDYFLAGDLLNQITVSGYSAAELGLPFFGLYGACSTLTLALSWEICSWRGALPKMFSRPPRAIIAALSASSATPRNTVFNDRDRPNGPLPGRQRR